VSPLSGFRLEIVNGCPIFISVCRYFLFIYLLSVDSVTQTYIKPNGAMFGK